MNKLNYSDVKNIFIEKKVACNFDDIFDDNYEQAHQYSSMGRSFNFGIRKVY